MKKQEIKRRKRVIPLPGQASPHQYSSASPKPSASPDPQRYSESQAGPSSSRADPYPAGSPSESHPSPPDSVLDDERSYVHPGYAPPPADFTNYRPTTTLLPPIADLRGRSPPLYRLERSHLLPRKRDLAESEGTRPGRTPEPRPTSNSIASLLNAESTPAPTESAIDPALSGGHGGDVPPDQSSKAARVKELEWRRERIRRELAEVDREIQQMGAG